MTQPPAVHPTAYIPVDHYSAVHLAAQAARSVAQRCGLQGALPDQAAVIASELGSNLAKHAVDGALYVQALPLGNGVEILAADRGPGMREFQRCLADGYTTTDTLGAGIGGVNRIATSFTVRTHEPGGTVACARLTPPEDTDAGRRTIGAVCLPAEREEVSGDACAVTETEQGLTAIVVDGLGHGPEAAEAAQLALRTFARVPDQPLPALLTTVHRALRRSRGAAVGLLRLHAGRAQYCGVGNVRCLTLTQQDVQNRLTGQPGVAGLEMPQPLVRDLPWEPRFTALLHTDGIDHRWAYSPPPFLIRLPAPLLATALVHGHRRSRDDGTVFAANLHQRLS
ncbi:SpoIIE family protein phosphatase [Streptomyces sp. NPDC018045]|uniref:SpoIIE family protein phosphatase n=1 Tax=Streptomyces sp. NPDC018045 TaxID=3365037 RepID=UPI00378F5DEF